MTFKQKLNKITFIIIFCIIIFCSCTNENGHNVFTTDDSIPTQEWFDKYIRHSTIIDKNGHTLIIYEIGCRSQPNYSFSIEHSQICEKCFKKYN